MASGSRARSRPCAASAAPDAITIDAVIGANAAMLCLIPEVMATSSNGSDRDTITVHAGFGAAAMARWPTRATSR